MDKGKCRNTEGKSRLTIAIIMSALSVFSISAAAHPDRYDNLRLRTIAEITGLAAVADTLSDGLHTGFCSYRNFPVTINVADGVVDHIGVQLFTGADRESMSPYPVYDFLERYLLEHHIQSRMSENDRHHSADRVKVETGSLKDLHKVCGDTTLSFSVQLDYGRIYHAAWSRHEKDVFRISFPASYRLMGGFKADERENKLSAGISRTRSTPRPALKVDPTCLERSDTSIVDYHILKGGYESTPVVNSDRYYHTSDTACSMIFSPLYPVESLANMMVSGEIANGLRALVTLQRGKGETEKFSVPLNSLINFCLDEGCRPYFGLKGIYPDRDIVTALVEMVHPTEGYEHLLSITFDTTTLTTGEGDIEIRFTPYIPTHDIMGMSPDRIR